MTTTAAPAFRQVLGSGHLGPDGADMALAEVRTGEHAAVSMVLGTGGQVVDLGTPNSPTSFTVQARDPRAGQRVYLYDPETGDEISEQAAAGRP